jgi:putative endonuclease
MDYVKKLFSEVTLSYTVYILKSDSTSQFYIGHTDNLERRISEHNDPSCERTQYTKRHRGPWKCVYTERYETRSLAITREKQIKDKKSRKYIEYLIANGNELS